MQATAPCALICLVRQLRHSVADARYLPALQSAHKPPLVGLALLPAHGVHVLAPVPLSVPALQVLHSAACGPEYLPAVQGVHWEFVLPLAAVPAGQGLHTVPIEEYHPAPHARQGSSSSKIIVFFFTHA